MKKITLMLVATCLISFNQQGFAQDTLPARKGFRYDKLFTGGSLNLSFFGGSTMLGVIPHFGYSLNRFADVAVTLNANYISQRDYMVYDDKVRQTTIGPGAFVRLFPVRFLFAQAQYEHNFITLKYIPAPNSGYNPERSKLQSNSYLVGGGYATGRDADNNTYGYFSVMWDAGKDKNSPYKDGNGRNIPVIRAGLNVALFEGKANNKLR